MASSSRAIAPSGRGSRRSSAASVAAPISRLAAARSGDWRAMSVGLEGLGRGLSVGADHDLFDLLFGGLQLRFAVPLEQRAAAVERDRLLKVDPAAFQLGHDLVQRL